jgi:hypothetical protein
LTPAQSLQLTLLDDDIKKTLLCQALDKELEQFITSA